jgi:hypothetical protein
VVVKPWSKNIFPGKNNHIEEITLDINVKHALHKDED